MPCTYLGTTVYAMGAVFIFHQNIGIQLQLHAVIVKDRSNPSGMHAGHIGNRIFNMSSDVSHTVGNARLLRVRPPYRQLGCRLSSAADLINQPFLQILCIYVDDLPDLSLFYQFSGQFYHTVACICISHCKADHFSLPVSQAPGPVLW